MLAELWDGIVLPFPPSPDSFIVLANDGKGSVVEVTPIDVVLEPGTGLPDDEGFSTETLTDENGAQFVRTDFRPQHVSTHLNISTRMSIDEIKAIGEREGWRTLVCNRDRGLFQLVELWIEDRFMLEVMTPEQTPRYVEITSPEFIAIFFAESQMVPPAQPAVTGSLSLIG